MSLFIWKGVPKMKRFLINFVIFRIKKLCFFIMHKLQPILGYDLLWFWWQSLTYHNLSHRHVTLYADAQIQQFKALSIFDQEKVESETKMTLQILAQYTNMSIRRTFSLETTCPKTVSLYYVGRRYWINCLIGL
jgi:hypothetical protein